MEIPGSLRQEFVDTPSAKETVLYANSPAFLLERLRKDNAVSYIAKNLASKQILDTLAELRAAAPTDPIQVVRAYIFLVAMALKDDLNSHRARLCSMDISQLQWGSELRQRILAENVASTRVEVKYQKLQESKMVGTTSSVSTGIVSKVSG